MRKYLAEFIATFFLVFIGAGSIIADHYLTAVRFADSFGLLGIAFAHGLALAIAIAAIARISGGHANPAISIAAWVSRRLNARDLGGYIVAQLLGGGLAAVLLKGLTPAQAYSEVGVGVPALGEQISSWDGVALEVVLTFFLAFTIWGVAVDRRGPKAIAPLAIGLVVTFDILAGGAFTGAAMNPARWFGPALAAGPAWANWWVWTVGPIIGALLGSLVYENFFLADQPPVEDTALDGEEDLLPEDEEDLLIEDELFGAEKEPEVVEPATPERMERPRAPAVTAPDESPPLRPPPAPEPTRPQPPAPSRGESPREFRPTPTDRPPPGRPEPGRPEPMRPEPQRPEPPRPQPGRPEPYRPEPMRPQPPRPGEPERPQPGRPEPMRPQPDRPQPPRPEPMRPEGDRPQPPRPEPMRPEPGRPQPPRPEPPRPTPGPSPQPPRPEPGGPQPPRPDQPPSRPPEDRPNS